MLFNCWANTRHKTESNLIHNDLFQDLPDAPYILESMIDTLEEERNTMVKLSLLTATIKLFFIRPAECQDMLGKILEYAIGTKNMSAVRAVATAGSLQHG